jgi:hypothetical protein
VDSDCNTCAYLHTFAHKQRHSVGAAAPLLFEYRVASDTEVSINVPTPVASCSILHLAIDFVSALLTKQAVARLLLGNALLSVLVDAMRCLYAIAHAYTALILLLYRVVTTSISYLR